MDNNYFQLNWYRRKPLSTSCGQSFHKYKCNLHKYKCNMHKYTKLGQHAFNTVSAWDYPLYLAKYSHSKLVGILLKKKCCNEQRNNSIKIGCKINNPHIKKKEKKENTLLLFKLSKSSLSLKLSVNTLCSFLYGSVHLSSFLSSLSFVCFRSITFVLVNQSFWNLQKLRLPQN
jgi:hypothetical protein